MLLERNDNQNKRNFSFTVECLKAALSKGLGLGIIAGSVLGMNNFLLSLDQLYLPIFYLQLKCLKF